jgi:group I intron endonuclease
MKYKGIQGVYSIQSLQTSKIYIGSTNCLYRRINAHLKDLLADRHHNICLQNHVNKYGIDDLKVQVLKLCIPKITRKELYSIEQLYLDNYLNNWRNCFNIHRDVNYFKNNPLFRELQKLGVKRSWSRNYDELKIIVCKNLEKAQKEYRRKLDSGELIRIGSMKGKKHSLKSREQMSISAKKRGRHPSTCKKIFQYNLHGTFITEWSCARDFVKSINISIQSATNVTNCALGKKKYAYGFIWKYYKVDQLQLIFTLENVMSKEKIQFLDLSSISRYIKCDPSILSRALKNNRLVRNIYKIHKNER